MLGVYVSICQEEEEDANHDQEQQSIPYLQPVHSLVHPIA
jgi:hypothetical protein